MFQIFRIPKDDSSKEIGDEDASDKKVSKVQKQSSPRNSIQNIQKNNLEQETTPSAARTTSLSDAITSTSATTLVTVVDNIEQDSGEEAGVEINNEDNEISANNDGMSNDRIKDQDNDARSFNRFKPVSKGVGARRRGGPRFRNAAEKVTEKQPEDFSQTASNLFLSTFMGAQRTEPPIISSTTSKMFIVTMAQESYNTADHEQTTKGELNLIQLSFSYVDLMLHYGSVARSSNVILA